MSRSPRVACVKRLGLLSVLSLVACALVACARTANGQAEPPRVVELTLVGDLRLDAGFDEIGSEHIAEVLHSSTLAFLEGEAVSARGDVERTLSDEPSASAAGPSVATRSASPAARPSDAVGRRTPRGVDTRRRWGGGLGYGVSCRGDEGTWHGPRASVYAALFRRGRARGRPRRVPTTT